ncbi:hypothetical protein ABZ490_40195 [Streptomyces sp. NPDC005811]|uniref:hypothetical protein n=1 Tax=Streptomyces sp. NPDC005811 TaxID=3154565 RepID=UPI0033DCE266
MREAERGYATNRASRTAYDRHKEAVEAADHAGVRARLLRADWEEQEEVRRARVAAGEAAAREMAPRVEGLAASRADAVEAVLAAVTAMGAALDALGEHDRLVRAASAELAGRGLRSLNGEETGAGMDEAAWIGGTCWPLVDGGGVLARLLADLVVERSPRHPLGRAVWLPYGGMSAGKGRDAVLALVAAERGR